MPHDVAHRQFIFVAYDPIHLEIIVLTLLVLLDYLLLITHLKALGIVDDYTKNRSLLNNLIFRLIISTFSHFRHFFTLLD